MSHLDYRTFNTSTFIATLISILFAGYSHAQSDLDFPYQALVLREGAKVHSGPGSVHYGTDSLKQGDVVEVYEHDPGGWCAIRPPEGSFSLIPEGAMNLVGKGVGQIKVDGTKAWVGTKLGPVENPLWQVKLKRREMVEVIGQINWPQPEGHSTIWYQIAPPAGEFRWIQISNIQLPAAARMKMQQDKLNQSKNVTPDNGQVRSMVNLPVEGKSASQLGVRQAGMEVELNQPLVEAPTNNGWRQATRPIRNRTLTNSALNKYGSSNYNQTGNGSLNRVSSIPNNVNGSSRSSTLDSKNYDSSFGRSPDQRYLSESKPAEAPATMARNSRAGNRFADANLSANTLAQRLERVKDAGIGIADQSNFPAARMSDLELALTREMVKEPTSWKLDDLELRATTLFRTTTDLSERTLADRFLTKIENCRKIQTGFQSGINTTGTTSGLRRRSATAVGTGTQTNIALGTTYDAHGWLNQLVRDGSPNQPEYVLQDSNGKITHHVRAIQGMNLHRYLKSYVGIIGQRGYHNRLKLDHVTAQRVVELQKQPR